MVWLQVDSRSRFSCSFKRFIERLANFWKRGLWVFHATATRNTATEDVNNCLGQLNKILPRMNKMYFHWCTCLFPEQGAWQVGICDQWVGAGVAKVRPSLAGSWRNRLDWLDVAEGSDKSPLLSRPFQSFNFQTGVNHGWTSKAEPAGQLHLRRDRRGWRRGREKKPKPKSFLDHHLQSQTRRAKKIHICVKLPQCLLTPNNTFLRHLWSYEPRHHPPRWHCQCWVL